MGRVTTLEERILINELADAGYTDPEIAEMVGWSRWTVRKWRRRGSHGRQALASKMGRPIRGKGAFAFAKWRILSILPPYKS